MTTPSEEDSDLLNLQERQQHLTNAGRWMDNQEMHHRRREAKESAALEEALEEFRRMGHEVCPQPQCPVEAECQIYANNEVPVYAWAWHTHIYTDPTINICYIMRDHGYNRHGSRCQGKGCFYKGYQQVLTQEVTDAFWEVFHKELAMRVLATCDLIATAMKLVTVSFNYYSYVAGAMVSQGLFAT